MKKGYFMMSAGFFLSSFCLSVGGIRILPPFLGLLLMVFGMAWIRDYYSNDSSRAASLFCKINVALSFCGSLISLSSFAPSSPLAPALPALPCLFAISYTVCAVVILLIFRQAAEYFPKYSTCGEFWRICGVIVPFLYGLAELIRALSCFAAEPFGAWAVIFCTVVDTAVFILFIVAALSNHDMTRSDTDGTDHE